MRAALRLLFNGDASQWDRAMQLPHYNSRSMPAISLHTGLHLIQVQTSCAQPAASVCGCCVQALIIMTAGWSPFAVTAPTSV